MFRAVDGLLHGAVADGVIPGISICIRNLDGVLHRRAFGAAALVPSHRPADVDTVWDLASLTKVLAATPVAMTMVERGELSLDTPVRDVLGDVPEGITVAHLLSHSSGAAAWLPMVEILGGSGAGTVAMRERVLFMARNASLESSPGTEHRYSDLGFLMLCSVIETVAGLRISELYEERVAGPSGARLYWGHRDAAATENCPVRGKVVSGTVHDLNAWLMGGVSTHAGLFGTADAAAANAAWQLRAYRGCSEEGLCPEVVQTFMNYSGPGSHRLGWDGVSPNGSAGPHWPSNGIGHLAFTGCSIWMAPDEGVVVSVVSNRVHPEIEGGAVPDAPIHPRYAAFRALRPALHSAVLRDLGLA